MAGTGGFLFGSMLARIFGPIVYDFIEFKTPYGKKIAQDKYGKERESKLAERDDKLVILAEEQKNKLEQIEKQLKIQFEQNRKTSEEKIILSLSEWQQKVFWEKCFPLRNPFEMPLGIDLKFQESKDRIEGNKEIERCCVKTVEFNNKRIVPLRVITALKDKTSPHAATVSCDLSMFLSSYYSSNSGHSVVSDIGSWRDDAPIDDASINFLFRGQRGLPTLVIMPTYTNGDSILRMKLWSWGLGEDLAYPIGFDFGWFNLEIIYRHVLLEEIKSFDSTLRKIGRRDDKMKTPYKDFETGLSIVGIIEDGGNLADNEREQLLSLLQRTPPELSSIVQRKANEIISTIYSCATAMYADGYHLKNYGTSPILPYILPQMPGAKILLPQILQYYMTMFRVLLAKDKISYEEAIGIEMDMYEIFKSIDPALENFKRLKIQIRDHQFEIRKNLLCDESTTKRIDNRIKLLLS